MRPALKTRKQTMKKYQAVLTGPSIRKDIRAEFNSITECRKWAESYGTTADACSIWTNSIKNPRNIAWHRRSTEGNGMSWFRAA